MRRKRIYGICIFFLVLIVSCTETQMKNIQEKAPNLLATIANGWGGPYAGLMSTFAGILKGEQYPPGMVSQQPGATPPYNAQGAQQPYYDQANQGQYAQGTQQPHYDQANQGQYAQDTQQPYYDQANQGQYAQGAQQPYYDQANQGQYAQDTQQPYYDQANQGQYAQGTQQPYYDQAGQGQYNQPVSYSQSLAVEIDVVKEVYENGQYLAMSVKNGDRLTRDDNYKVQYICNMECYVYIAQLDAIGKLVPIIPSEFVGWGNPMTPNRVYSVPEGNKWFFLDENKGMEQIFFIVSRTRRPDIEQLFRKISAENKTLKQQAPITINEPLYASRGLAGVREGRQQEVTFQNGSQGRYDSTLFESMQADFVVTRWFYHD
jgi:hypothetical protein